MRIGRVIGRVVLSDRVPEYRGGRWLLVSPCGLPELVLGGPTGSSGEPSLVVYDDLGAGEGDIVGFSEGGEATKPFSGPMPIDAYNCCLLDTIYIEPRYREES